MYPKLILELDGSQHLDKAAYDEERNRFLMSEGFQVVRFWDNEVLQHPEDVANCILRALTLRPPQQPLLSLEAGPSVQGRIGPMVPPSAGEGR